MPKLRFLIPLAVLLLVLGTTLACAAKDETSTPAPGEQAMSPSEGAAMSASGASEVEMPKASGVKKDTRGVPGAFERHGEMPFPNVHLVTPKDADQAAYLGVDPAAEGFDFADIKSDWVLVEIFNSYCPHCQAEAPHIAKLYGMVADKGWDKKLKIVGLAANNTEFEVELFDDRYQLPFPLFADPDLSIYEAIGQVPTPTYFLVRLPKDGQTEPVSVYKHVGRFSTPEEFLEVIQGETGF